MLKRVLTSEPLLVMLAASCINADPGDSSSTNTGNARPSDQEEVIIDSEAMCADCRVELTPVMEIGDPEGVGMLEAEFNWLTPDSHGRYYVYNTSAPYFWIFDSTGEAVRRVGRSGEGPGEFREITRILVAANDSLFVHDFSLGRVTVLSDDTLLARTFSVPFTDATLGLLTGDFLIARGVVSSPERRAQPLHVLSMTGEIGLSFGGDTALWRPELRGIVDMRSVATGDSTTIWAGWWNQYLVERFDTAGNRIQAFRRNPDWFPAWWTPESSIDLPPHPILIALQQSGDTLWVLNRIADPEWQSAVEPAGRMFRITDEARYFDTVIEAIDIRQNRLIASTRQPIKLTGFAGVNLVYGEGIDSSGNPVVPIWKLSIARED